MKALVIGGGGGIGLHLCRKLYAQGCAVDIVDDNSRGYTDSELSDFTANDGVRLISGDLRSASVQGQLADDYDGIHHLAAILGVQRVLDSSFEVLTLNVALAETAIELAKQQRNLNRFVFYSTSEVYAGTLHHHGLTFPTPISTPLTVSALEAPRTSYMLSKIYGEALVHQSGLPFTIFRPHNIYGPRMGAAHVIPQVAERMSACEDGAAFPVYSPTHQRTFCYVGDAVDWIARLTTNDIGLNRTYNLGRQEPEVSMLQLTREIAEVLGRQFTFVEEKDAPGSPVRRCPDIGETIRDSGFGGDVDLRSGLEATLEWYRNNR